MKPKYLIGIAIIVVFVIFGALSFRTTLTPYVSFGEAQRTGAAVQVIGDVVFPEVEYDTETHQLQFPIVDEKGERMAVVYGGTKPANFEQAEEVVVIGRYENGAFTADQLLVKCPSKYQGSPTGDSVEVEHPDDIPKDSP
ncbi:MAG: cytochrome c maturation protein CcmE [Candidatus Zixiibacteriota bacterium]|nr:MAG: cytochrome c maturation protein CcmE [candidate division Zixibacteria bacterium]